MMNCFEIGQDRAILSSETTMTKVLIVDDDQTMRSLYERVFSLEGFTVELGEGGKTGLEKAQTVAPDIILLDMMMPGVNGLEVLEKLKADPATAHIPVIVMSNYSELNISTRAIDLGAAQYLIKSDVDPSVAVEIVRKTLGQAEQTS